MFSLGWIIGVGIFAGMAGVGLGIWYNQRSGVKERVLELEEQLASAQRMHEDYRQEVFDQFSDTAKKFQTLNESYVDLHQHLAKSADVLCGDMAAGFLLEGTLVSALTDASGDHEGTGSAEPIVDADVAIIVAAVPPRDEVLQPLDEADLETQPATITAATTAPTPDLDNDSKVREAG